MKKALFKLFFLLLFAAGSYYTLYIETEKYESSGIVMVKNLSQEQSVSTLGSLLTSVSSGASQDSKVLELYIRSHDMFGILNKEYNLTSYYTSEEIDPLHRLYPEADFPYISATGINLLKKYNQDIHIDYDQTSSSIKISYRHTDAHTAKNVIERIIRESTEILNKFEHENANIALSFLTKQAEKNKEIFMESIKKMIAYQNKHNTVDPKQDIKMESNLLANLQSTLIQKEVEYSSQRVRKKSSSASMRAIKQSIRELKNKINTIKKRISGKTGKTLNISAFDFEVLSNDAELSKEIYRQTLIKLEETKVSVSKSAKNLTVVSNPIVSDMYISPDKPSQIFSLFIILGFLYSIIYLIIMIIKSHRD